MHPVPSRRTPPRTNMLALAMVSVCCGWFQTQTQTQTLVVNGLFVGRSHLHSHSHSLAPKSGIAALVPNQHRQQPTQLPARRREHGGDDRYESSRDGGFDFDFDFDIDIDNRKGNGNGNRSGSGGRGRNGSNGYDRRSNNNNNNNYEHDSYNDGDDSYSHSHSNSNSNNRSSRSRSRSMTPGRGRNGGDDSSRRQKRGNGGNNNSYNNSYSNSNSGNNGYGNRNNNKNYGSRQPRGTPEETAEITQTNAHFFSKKPLTDPTFYEHDREESDGNDDGNNDEPKSTNQELHRSLCRGAGITRPSRIQSLAWPQILSGKHTIVADQTGSGKTCAYLIPCLLRALQTPPIKANGAPKVLILAPTAELADQIQAVCTKISSSSSSSSGGDSNSRFNTMVVTANGKFTTSIRDQIRMVQRKPVDILISTPGRISTILRTRNSGLDLSNVQSIVLDEVDILMIDETFGPQLRTVGEAAPLLDKTQFVFVTATLPDSIVRTITTEFPGVVRVKGPGLHRPAPSLKEHLVDVSVPSASNRNEDLCFDLKAKALLKALRQNRCRRTLVFCNTVESCRSVENLLNRKDRRGRVYEILAYHSAMTPEARNTNLQIFAGGRRGDNKNNEDVDYVLVCTDRAARGVDFDEAPVNHCVVFDFPKDPAEYIRRVGRTARAGRIGTSTVFAYGWQLPIARNVMGKKLDSFTIATSDMKYDENDYELRFDRRTKKRRDQQMKEKIENGSLWE
mmetsp:Transcript_16399/g.34179  ORF Transcript_16399/g.34179 Transcript_16399/m.34179 type:complete len:734 (-) Transcript_16399:302-2503(-)